MNVTFQSRVPVCDYVFSLLCLFSLLCITFLFRFNDSKLGPLLEEVEEELDVPETIPGGLKRKAAGIANLIHIYDIRMSIGSYSPFITLFIILFVN